MSWLRGWPPRSRLRTAAAVHAAAAEAIAPADATKWVRFAVREPLRCPPARSAAVGPAQALLSADRERPSR